MEKLFSGVKIVDGYKLVVTALGTDYEKCYFVFTVKTDINDNYYSDSNGRDYSIFVDGFTEIVDLIDLLNRKENIVYFLSVQEGNHATHRQSTHNDHSNFIFLTTFRELVYMVNIEEINNALAITFPSLILIRLITTCEYDSYEVKFILVMKRRDKQGRTVVSRQRIIAYDTDSIYKECCKAAKRFMNKDTGQGR